MTAARAVHHCSAFYVFFLTKFLVLRREKNDGELGPIGRIGLIGRIGRIGRIGLMGVMGLIGRIGLIGLIGVMGLIGRISPIWLIVGGRWVVIGFWFSG